MLLLSVNGAFASTKDDSGLAVEGMDRARMLPPPGAVVAEYRNHGYKLSRLGQEIEIEVDTSALESKTAFRAKMPATGDDPMTRLARSLTLHSTTRYDAVGKVLSWVARNIRYNLDRSQSQEALFVLERRSGYCTGVARLTVSLLRSVDIPAREVAGYVLGQTSEAKQGYHRWIEVFFPDRGWVFSDPLTSHHWVPSTYVRLGSELLNLRGSLEGLLLERTNGVMPVDLFPHSATGVRVRRNFDRQIAGALRIQLENSSHGLAVLEGAGERRSHALVDGATTFVGLQPGNYFLHLNIGGERVLDRSIEFRGPQRTFLSLPLPGAKVECLGAACQERLPAGRLTSPGR